MAIFRCFSYYYYYYFGRNALEPTTKPILSACQPKKTDFTCFDTHCPPSSMYRAQPTHEFRHHINLAQSVELWAYGPIQNSRARAEVQFISTVVEINSSLRTSLFTPKRKVELKLKKVEYAKMQTQLNLICWFHHLHRLDLTVCRRVHFFFCFIIPNPLNLKYFF